MDQIRFDFLGGVNGSGTGRSANAPATETGDAFAQILDQQLTRRTDADAGRRAADTRSRSDASDRADAPRPQVLKRRDERRSDRHSAAAAQPDTASAKPAPKAKPVEKPASDDGSACNKPAAKPRPDETETTTEAAPGRPAAPESGGTTAPAEAESQSDASGQDAGSQGDGSQQPAGDGSDPGETVAAAEPDPGLLALLAVPLPLQTVTADAGAAADTAAPASGNAAAAALQAGLAARLAGSLELGTTPGATGKAQGQAAGGGLKFGAVLQQSAARPQPGAADAASLQDTAGDPAETTDPLAALVPNANNGTKPREAGTSASAKLRDAAKSATAAAVPAEQNGKPAAAAVQPMNRGAGVTWSATTLGDTLTESVAAGAGGGFAADESEFSNWSQVLGSNAGGLSGSLATRQSAFMAQLKQNLQVLPPHEQIAVQIKNAMQNGNSRLTVALHPAELGRVEVKLDIDKDKKVTATVLVDRPATLDLLQKDAKALERALQDAGLQADSGSLSFSLRDGNGQNGGAAQNGTGTGGAAGGTGSSGGTEANAGAIRSDVVATADGYVDLET